MSDLNIVLEEAEHDDKTSGYFAWCEGCDSRHYIPTVGAVNWLFNENLSKPTFEPSILIYEYEGHHPRCHSFICDGVWDYLSDCTHALAGTQRALLKRDEWPEETWPNGSIDE